MAKSLRSKSKRAFRALKRTGEGSTKGAYANAEAMRIERLNLKLMAIKERRREEKQVKVEEEQDGGVTVDEDKDGDVVVNDLTTTNETMEIIEVPDEPIDLKKVSTSGQRTSGREQWKASKGIKKKKSATVFGGGRGGGRRKNRR